MTEPEYEIETVEMRSIFEPRWWQIRRRFHKWQRQRDLKQRRAQLTADQLRVIEEYEREIDRAFLLGDKHGA